MDRVTPESPAPPSPDREVESARLALAGGDVPAAAAHLARALAHDVGRREWLIQLDEIVNAGGLDPDAIAPLGDQPYFAVVAVRAYILARRRELTAAIQLLLRVFAVEPRVPFIRWGVSWLSAPGAAARVDEGEIVYSLIQLLQRFPGDDLDEEQREQLGETLPLLDALDEAHPTSWRLSWIRSMILRKMRLHEEASLAAERAFALEPASGTAIALAYARREEGEIAAARAAFEAAQRFEPDNLEITADLAQLLCGEDSQGAMDEGLALFAQILARDPRHHCAYPASRFYRALHGDDAGAYAELAEHVAANPGDEEAASWLASARRAWLHPPVAPEVNESFLAGIAAALAHTGSHDPDLQHFGARSHRYRLDTPMAEARLVAIEALHGVRLPVDYRAFLARVGAAGAGPFHGLLPLDAPSQLGSLEGSFPHLRPFRPDLDAMSEEAREEFESDATVAGTIALAHMGCQYFSILVVKGARPGSVWADLRSAGLGLVPTHEDFTGWYADWVRALVNDEPLAIPVPAGRCAPQHALTTYLQSWEQNRAIEGDLTPEQLHEALRGIGEGGIETGADASRYFDAGDPLDVCPLCDRVFQYLAEHGGLRPEQIKPGIPPKAARRRATDA